MRAIKAKISRSLPIGSRVNVKDNSGARIISIISVRGYKTRTRKLAAAGVADLVMASVKVGKPEVKKQVVPAVIIRQKQAYTRPDGTKIKFEDNAAVLLKDVKLGLPKGTAIKGPIAREVAIRWPQIAKIANMVI